MTDEDYIRKAVDLLGWAINGTAFFMAPWSLHIGISTAFTNVEQWELDAIAAELVRQVDLLGGVRFFSAKGYTEFHGVHTNPLVINGPNDRTMNTIRAIIDSKVLDQS